jgi:hypothetical protein
LDVDLLAVGKGRQDGFRRVLVGAPLWIRTVDPHAIRLYATSDDSDIAANRQAQRLGDKEAKEVLSRPNDLDHGKDKPRVAVEHSPMNVKAEDAWKGPTVTIPDKIYQFLKAGFVGSMADWAINQVRTDAEHRIDHLGDPFGLVFAWIWADDRDQAMILLADYMSDLREGHPLVI